MKRLFGFLHLVWIFCWAALATLVVALPCIVVAYLSSTGNLAFTLTKLWARIVLAASFVRMRIVHPERIEKGRSYIVIANHQSFYDILAIVTTLGIQFRWVIKKGVLKLPLFGYALYAARNIFIDRSDPRGAMASILKGTRRLPPGVSVMIFPEGNRSMDGSIRPFKKGRLRHRNRKEMACSAADDQREPGGPCQAVPGRLSGNHRGGRRRTDRCRAVQP